ncbi:MAG: RsiV family protein [Prevotella sp.]
MRHILHTLPLIILFPLLVSSCASRGTSQSLSPVRLTFDSITVSDSSVIGPQAMAYFDLKCLYPTSPSSPVVDSLLSWTAAVIADTIVPRSYVRQTTLRRAAVQLSADSSEIRSIISGEELSRDSRIIYQRDIDIRPIYTDSAFVTLQATLYDYTAGAHGSTRIIPQTFSLADGSRVALPALLPSISPEALADSIQRGLMEYFDVQDGDTLRLRDMLFVDDAQPIPMPQTQPFLTAEGVVFIYQQYEIAAYAAGMPQVVVRRVKAE